MIQVQNLTKKFNDITAVNEASFEIRDGEVLGFLGPNAAGKTTTMRIITGFIAPTSGTVKVGDLDVRENSLEIRKKIGYLPESVPLYEDMKVYEYLKFIAEVRSIPGNKVKTRIREMIEACGLQKVIRQQVGELSKGYRQRVGLAQAMIHEPEILVLDEPTSGLDPNQIAEIRSLIKKLGEQKTVILSTHILSEVQATCSRVVIINDGKIVASGTTEELQRQAAGQEMIYIKFKAEPHSVLERVNALEEVSTVERADQEDELIFGYKVEVSGGRDLREALFNLAVANGWKVLEMRRERVSLEDVFRKLTTN
ncbi:ABC transporter ATP-binding protein [Patescibacteria group bacterium]|nr:ABC transporter ATP-binding protein [Patescibacteria group bacterium]MBU4512255.1 ABC transporter ATP-binding protein [Patescibacteria group bacterium]MCG2692931.1 ABC transporter ATP-binding protein [Candidatus Parcubacteria bacterium]